jgi:ubiquitin-like domain-containing CTD phosphatase 1
MTCNTLLTNSCSSDLGLINGKKFTLVGTPRGHELKDPSRLSVISHARAWANAFSFAAELELLSDVVNDLDVDFSSNPSAAESHKNDQRNIRKIREATANLKINLIHPLREGKRLLVLDIDYS